MSANRLLHRPIFGGVFGDEGRFALASVPLVTRGLHSVRFMVVQPEAGTVLSISEDKVEALSLARRRLTAANDEPIDGRPVQIQCELWPIEYGPERKQERYVSRRRRDIFERSEGRCFYCGVGLELDGQWHVEHQLPRALGGGEDGLNLVAACAACNLSKSDRTAIEFASDLTPGT